MADLAGEAPASVVIRPATEAEAERCLVLFHWLMDPPGRRPAGWDDGSAAAAIRRLIASPDSDLLVALSRDEVVGACTVYLVLDSVRFGRRAWVEDLAVDPGRRSRGIGKLLLEAAKAWAKERGATHLELESSVAREDAHRFYHRENPAWESRSFGWTR
jgi:GNAT superfamily N-acetyltransferase